MPTTITVISDTHSHLDSRIEALIQECDIAVHAGDICGLDLVEKLRPKSGKIIAVAGNNDRATYGTGETLPNVLSFEVEDEVITVEHGHEHGKHKPDHESLRKAHPNSKLIIYGHTHKQVIDKSSNPWVLNPGAAGQTRTHGGPSCLTIECSKYSEWKIEKFRFSE